MSEIKLRLGVVVGTRVRLSKVSLRLVSNLKQVGVVTGSLGPHFLYGGGHQRHGMSISLVTGLRGRGFQLTPACNLSLDGCTQ